MIPYILVVEDNEDLQEYLRGLLTENDYVVKTTSYGKKAYSMVEKTQPNLILLDLNLPDVAGEVLCRQIKDEYPEVSIVMLTAKDSVESKIQGLKDGADDYITKPFSSEELIARIKTRLKNDFSEESILKIGDLELNKRTIEVKRGDKTISLTPQEFKLLEYLMNNKNVVLTRDMILNRIWLYSPDVESRVVDVYVGYLRKKIDGGFDKKLIQSIRGFGYTIKE